MPVEFMMPDGKLGPLGTELQGLNIRSPRFRGLDTLRKDEWKGFDTVLVEVAQQRLNVVADLLSRGLVLNIPNAMGLVVPF